MNDYDHIFALMTAEELRLYRAQGGLPASLEKRLASGGYLPEWAPVATTRKPYTPRDPARDVGGVVPPTARTPVELASPVECVERPSIWYPSVQDAAEGLGVKANSLLHSIRGEQRCRGLHWRVSQRRRKGHAA